MNQECVLLGRHGGRGKVRGFLAIVVVPAKVVAGEVVSPEVAPRIGSSPAPSASRGRIQEQLDVAVVHGVAVFAHCLTKSFIIRLLALYQLTNKTKRCLHTNEITPRLHNIILSDKY